MPDAANPRAARSRSAILQAAIELCAEHGFAAVTMEAIATRAAVGKPTVYRWWRSKSAVLLDALLEIWAAPVVPMTDSGEQDVVADLRRWLYGFVDTFNDPTLRPVIVGVLGAAQLDPELKAAIRERVHAPLRAGNQTCLVAAQRAGLLPAIDPELLEDSLVAPLWYRLLVSDEPVDRDYADAVLAAVLH
ncbi:TetR/AcrR family transcriptional regulator [Nocardia sp. NPDC059180]|uniref:TetR/AcrR family transcriptional regulator n=1 Tax=Nocardia sp. NPDC059180 TaxID=3346761 RepID=UPI0036B0B549